MNLGPPTTPPTGSPASLAPLWSSRNQLCVRNVDLNNYRPAGRPSSSSSGGPVAPEFDLDLGPAPSGNSLRPLTTIGGALLFWASSLRPARLSGGGGPFAAAP